MVNHKQIKTAPPRNLPHHPAAIDAQYLKINSEVLAFIHTRLAEMKSTRQKSSHIIPKKQNLNWKRPEK